MTKGIELHGGQAGRHLNGERQQQVNRILTGSCGTRCKYGTGSASAWKESRNDKRKMAGEQRSDILDKVAPLRNVLGSFCAPQQYFFSGAVTATVTRGTGISWGLN